MYLGYNTNGFAHHDPFQAIELLAELGYEGIGISVDHQLLNPLDPEMDKQLDQIARELQLYRLNSVVETGARYLLNPNVKHEPTMLSDGRENREKRIAFLKHCIDIAARLGSECVSLWSGRKPDTINLQTAMDRLAESLKPVIDYAAESGVLLGFEPEPGMLIDTLASFERLLQWTDHPNLKLTMDIGHLFCQGEVPIVDYIERWQSRIVNIHIEDIKAGVHEHLMFGDGQIYFPPVMEALSRIDYDGGVFVELSRHSHDAPVVARQSMEFLSPMFPGLKSRNVSFDPRCEDGPSA